MTTVANGTAKAWAHINGGSNAVVGGFNISSVTDLGAAVYQFNFTTAMAAANYCVVTSIGDYTGTSFNNDTDAFPCAQTTTSFRVYCQNENDTSTEPTALHVVVFKQP